MLVLFNVVSAVGKRCKKKKKISDATSYLKVSKAETLFIHGSGGCSWF